MKISITLSRDQAEVLARVTFIDKPIFNNREQRVHYSLMREITVKATRFYMSFTTQKYRKFWLKAYEADLLEKFIDHTLKVVEYGTYERQTLFQIMYEIDEQLA